ncbi:unannotated protein [freshwater metagenome]|uniref:Unannotated protein n=1 Tax=freshwater metagenome TaxID=449393 RepID=A0A6J7GD57_9ZZZZ|nr:hypothetical protein [Actinomycetota bacterium]
MPKQEEPRYEIAVYFEDAAKVRTKVFVGSGPTRQEIHDSGEPRGMVRAVENATRAVAVHMEAVKDRAAAAREASRAMAGWEGGPPADRFVNQLHAQGFEIVPRRDVDAAEVAR